MFQYGHRLGDVSRKHDDRTIFLAGIREFPNAAVYTILGALLPLLLATLLGVDSEALNMGLMGYNGVLCALALGGKSWMSCIWAACSVLLSVVLQIVGMNWGIITLTAPFVLSVWLTMGIKISISFSN